MTGDPSLEATLPRAKRSLHVNPARSPGWIPRSDRLPGPGERIHTHEGTGVAERILHKTADVGRGLEITMDDGRNPPFFAASANVPSAAAGARLTAGGNG